MKPEQSGVGSSSSSTGSAARSDTRADARGDQDFDIFFDAYEENPRQAKGTTLDSAQRPPLDPEPDAPGRRGTDGRTAGSTDGRDDTPPTDSPYARDARVRDERERTGWERAPQTSAANRGRDAESAPESAPDSGADSSAYRFGREAGDRTGDAYFDSASAERSSVDSSHEQATRSDATPPHNGSTGWADIPPRRAPETESDSLLRSKVSDADYLSRRYGYTGDDEAAENGNTADFDADFDTEAGGRRSNRRGGEPKDTSQVYYERQRVDREERMSSAERRPDQPLRATPGSAPQNADDDSLASFAAGSTSGRGFTSRPVERNPDRASDRAAASYSDARVDRPNDDRMHDGRTRSADLDDLNFDSAPETRPEAEDQSWISQAREKWNWQDVSGVAKQVAPEVSGAESLYDFELAGYDRDPRIAQDLSSAGARAGAMSVAKSKSRSTLLPRMSSTSVDALHEQMAELHEQITIMLPEGHEYRARALGLLEKANTILENDPMRSAEVEYYLQQGRGIVQRQEHANRLSGLYRERLQLYLGAWLALSLVSLLARYVFQFEFDALLAGTFNLDYSGFVLQNAAALAGSVFAGALGGSIGALLTLMRHSRRPYGFVDRKYGLRGLILPVFGLLAGALIYLPFGLLYSLIGLDPSLNVIAASIAALCAFAFGFNQESLYGTRE
ncbi:MAG: hypothetical protein WDZ49_15410 [Litorilinea sp.]